MVGIGKERERAGPNRDVKNPARRVLNNGDTDV
jgi:hypothetical protein